MNNRKTYKQVEWEHEVHTSDLWSIQGKLVRCGCNRRGAGWQCYADRIGSHGMGEDYYSSDVEDLEVGKQKALDAARVILAREVLQFGGEVTWKD